jgi:two-component system sensor histidine kinase UhpB
MALRARVIGLIGLVLLISMLMGAVCAGLETRAALAEELRSGLVGAEQTVRSAFEDLPRSDHPTRDLRQLVSTFNGNRHVRAVLIARDGRRVAASTSGDAAHPAPPWFQALLDATPAPRTLATPPDVPGLRAIMLVPTAALDVDSAWAEVVGVAVVLLSSTLLGLALVYVAIGAALRPLDTLSHAFIDIGDGDYRRRVDRTGPPELLRLQQGFNDMVARLSAMSERNQLLTRQLLTLQEEERAEIARDLHDEIGPHLFAANLDAQMISEMCARRRHKDIPAQVAIIQEAIGHIQRQVRDLLGRLRPTSATELGLGAAIVDLTRFWGARRPDIAFSLSLLAEEADLSETLKDVSYRVIQEAVNNAIRHGDPRAIQIVLALDAGELIVRVADDGLGGGKAKGPSGFGLLGMRERVVACGGVLSFGPDPGLIGWTVVAKLPCPVQAQAQAQAQALGLEEAAA